MDGAEITTGTVVDRYRIEAVVGIGGMAAAIGGMFIAKLTGYILEWTGHYLPLFIMASVAYLIALLTIHLINPRFAPMIFRPATAHPARP